MIVRISGEDQYRLDESLHDQLDARGAFTAIDADESSLQAAFAELLDFVRANGPRSATRRSRPPT